jgi:hypothetical protein
MSPRLNFYRVPATRQCLGTLGGMIRDLLRLRFPEPARLSGGDVDWLRGVRDTLRGIDENKYAFETMVLNSIIDVLDSGDKIIMELDK